MSRCTARADGPRGRTQRAEGDDARSAGVDEQGAELEDLGAVVGREPGGLEVDDGDRTDAGGEARERVAASPRAPGSNSRRSTGDPAPSARHHLLDLLDLDPRETVPTAS